MREFREVRKDLSGDEAAPYIGLARTLLGQLKNRMAQGGLAQLARTVTLPDGTTISVASRLGQDTVRIIAAAPVLPVEQRPVEGLPEVPELEPVEVVPPEPVVPQPYMWIGARLRWEDYPGLYSTPPHRAMPEYGLGVVVLEPGDNGLVMNDTIGADFSAYRYADSTTDTIDLVAMQSQFSLGLPRAPGWMHNFGVWTAPERNSTQFMFTKHGLRLYSAFLCDIYSGSDEVFAPYDPLGKPHVGRTVPVEPGGDDYAPWAATHPWDQVVVLDPFEAQGIPPFDGRDDTTWARQLLKRSGVETGLKSVLPGNYEILVCAGDDPTLTSIRSNQASPYQGRPYRGDDFRENLVLSRRPMHVEIEVRLGKLPTMTRHHFTIVVQDYDFLYRTLRPYGFGHADGSDCAFFYGGNPMAANWWAGAILVNPSAGTAVRKDGYVSRIFEPEPFNIGKWERARFPVDIFYVSLGSDVPSLAGSSIFQIIDMQCTSYFGTGFDLVTRSAADVAGAAAGIAVNRVYRYDNISNTMTDVGYYDGLSDFALVWNPLRIASRGACRMPIWCNSVGQFGGGNFSMTGDPDLGLTCCPDTYFGS
jgi:hypothetical protein